MIRRRTLIAAALACPAVGRAAAASTLRFVPQADVAGTDPVWSSAQVTRNYAYLVFDTLYGVDAAYRAQPQMAEGAQAEDGFHSWTIRLRPGLRFHDGAPVLARNCVASLVRWGRRDSFGQALMAATAELTAPDDRTIHFRMARPFPLLLDALAKSTANAAVMMPQRLARTDPYQQVPEIVGSGPFRLRPDEGIPGARIVFDRNADYVPRETGRAEWTSGPKIVHFDRVEWAIIPDAATAAAALQNGEIDWWETPTTDYLDLLRRNPALRVAITDPSGSMPTLRMNWLQPPFDRAAIRRLVLRAVDQTDFMQAVAGTDPALYTTGVGIFPPGSASASTAGMTGHGGTPDWPQLRRDLVAAGYNGEPVVVLGASDRASIKALGDVAADALGRMGFVVDYQVTDWATASARANRKDPVAQGGWSVSFGIWSGLSVINPIVHQHLKSDGAKAISGWPDSPKIEALRAAWLDAPDPAAQAGIAAALQVQAFEDVPYVPLGQFFQPVAVRASLTGIVTGFPVFWNVRRA